MDFLRNRMFRQTLLCHADRVPDYSIGPERLKDLFVASPARPASAMPDIQSTQPERFVGVSGVTLTSSEPLIKAAMVQLAGVWPSWLPFAELQAAARRALGGEGTTDAADTDHRGQGLLKCYTSGGSGLLEVRARPCEFTLAVGERPCVTALAHLQASQGRQIANLRHEIAVLQEFDCQLLQYLDGTRSREELLAVLRQQIPDGALRMRKDARSTEEFAKDEGLRQSIEEGLGSLARNALLVAS